MVGVDSCGTEDEVGVEACSGLLVLDVMICIDIPG